MLVLDIDAENLLKNSNDIIGFRVELMPSTAFTANGEKWIKPTVKDLVIDDRMCQKVTFCLISYYLLFFILHF